mmetsp:Transcript_15116/g.46681  ORF Transcript_15116/g.46681 Transcript_15116/m.46681 type:complete len:206 (-) Transcript_15116:1301-1918(-)
MPVIRYCQWWNIWRTALPWSYDFGTQIAMPAGHDVSLKRSRISAPPWIGTTSTTPPRSGTSMQRMPSNESPFASTYVRVPGVPSHGRAGGAVGAAVVGAIDGSGVGAAVGAAVGAGISRTRRFRYSAMAFHVRSPTLPEAKLQSSTWMRSTPSMLMWMWHAYASTSSLCDLPYARLAGARASSRQLLSIRPSRTLPPSHSGWSAT